MSTNHIGNHCLFIVHVMHGLFKIIFALRKFRDIDPQGNKVRMGSDRMSHNNLKERLGSNIVTSPISRAASVSV